MTIRPIKNGEQLCAAYFPEDLMRSWKMDYKSALYSKFGFRCKCIKCEDELVDLKHIERDACFQQINHTDLERTVRNTALHQDFIAKCVTLLNKYSQVQWSRQLNFISILLGHGLESFYGAVEVK